jgi:hypothetical protein
MFAALTWSNDLGTPGAEDKDSCGPTSWLGWSGHFYGSGIRAPADLREALDDASSSDGVVARLGGAFALIHYDAGAHVLNAFTSLSGLPQLFVADRDDLAVVSTWADHAASIGSPDGSPEYDPRGMVGFCLSDFFNTSHLGFRGVELLSPNSPLSIAGDNVAARPVDDALRSWGEQDRVPTAADWDDIAHTFLVSLEYFCGSDIPVEISLSGGKDSRVVAAGLSSLQAQAYAKTGGWDSDPDVIVGRRLASELGLPWGHGRYQESADTDVVSWNFRGKMLEGIAKMGGLRISRPATPPVGSAFETHGVAWPEIFVSLSGTAGEILRGGGASRDRPYMQSLGATPTAGLVETSVREVFGQHRLHYFHPHLARAHMEAADAWIERSRSERYPTAILEKYDFEINQHRRVYPAIYLSADRGGEYVPLVDAQLLRKVGRLAAEYRTDHHVHFEIIRRVAPQVLKTPLADTRWGFEQDGPLPGDEAGYAARSPVKSNLVSKASQYAYYALPTDLRCLMEDEFFHGEVGDKVFEVVDRDRFRKLFYSHEVFHESTSYWLLNVYGAGLIMSGAWRGMCKREEEGERRDQVQDIRFDHPWQRMHSWLFHALNVHVAHFAQGAGEAGPQGVVRFIRNWLKTLEEHRVDLEIPVDKYRAELGRKSLRIDGFEAPLSSLGETPTIFEIADVCTRGSSGHVGVERFRRAVYQAYGLDPGPNVQIHGCEERALLDLSQGLVSVLSSGGDHRLTLDERSGLNSYGCSPSPRRAVSLSSTTASTIGEDAFAHVSALFPALVEQSRNIGALEAARLWYDRVRDSLAELLSLGVDADIVIAPSGTHCEYVALALSQAMAPNGVVNVLVGAEETGSGVRGAAAGRQFSGVTEFGDVVMSGSAVAGFDTRRIEVVDVPVREYDGSERPIGEIDRDVLAAVNAAIDDGKRPIVHFVHGTKTGIIAPSFALLEELVTRLHAEVDIFVDACQFRMDVAWVRRYVELGCLVAITGSKFVGGPPFSAALAVSRRTLSRIPPNYLLPNGLADYFSVVMWPKDWRMAEGAGRADCALGLMLRWEAALFELRGLLGLDLRTMDAVIRQFATALIKMTSAMDCVSLVPSSPSISSPADASSRSPLDRQTIFTLLLCGSGGRELTIEEAESVYRALYVGDDGEYACHVGQPVRVSRAGKGGAWRGTLRVSLGAPLLVQLGAMSPHNRELEIAQQLSLCFDRLQKCIDRLETPMAKLQRILPRFERWRSR